MLIYIHKENELAQVERLYPAAHYVLIDDKLRMLFAVKKIWGERVTTVFPSRGTMHATRHSGRVSARGTRDCPDRRSSPCDLGALLVKKTVFFVQAVDFWAFAK